MNERLLADLARALDATTRDHAGDYLHVVERILRPIDFAPRARSGRPPRDPLARVGFVVDLMNRVEADLPGGPRCMWVGSAEYASPRARAQLVRRAFPERDRERHNAMIGAIQFALGEAFPERAEEFREELLPALERYFVVGNVPVETRRPIASDLAEDIPTLASSLENRPSIVTRWAVETTAARWTLRAELRTEP